MEGAPSPSQRCVRQHGLQFIALRAAISRVSPRVGRVDAPSLALQPQRGLLLADVNLAASLVKKSADGLAQKCQRPDTKGW
ncbi:hypothetical protein HaLaN_05051 [Haematococcus lacustris]|uniref:Uncharacterized protein n=1 Tax=Haematococcus lacustris TaxID=44745 RepID=A0A699YSQ3_HAELA|nr:hypothetical protein HaLaN_05051 [Haematococcus lacustris]